MNTVQTISLAKRAGNFISSILLGETKETIVRIDEKVKAMDSAISEIKIDIKDIKASLMLQGMDIAGLKVHTKYGASNSPTAPSDLGKKLLNEAGFYEAYPRLKPQIFSLMDTKNLRTLYDYEKGAEQSLQELKASPLMDAMKDYSVNHPDESLELIFKVASWVIRDDYAKDRSMKKE